MLGKSRKTWRKFLKHVEEILVLFWGISNIIFEKIARYLEKLLSNSDQMLRKFYHKFSGIFWDFWENFPEIRFKKMLWKICDDLGIFAEILRKFWPNFEKF